MTELLSRRIDVVGRSRCVQKPDAFFERNQDLFKHHGVALGLVAGVPFGVVLHYALVCLYYPVVYVLYMLLWITPRSPHAFVDALVYQVDYGPDCAIFLLLVCIAVEILYTCQVAKQGQRPFALAQMSMSLVTVLPLFAYMLIKHQPFFPT